MIYTWLIYILIEAKVQHHLIEKRRWKPNYLQLFIIRGIVCLLWGSLIVRVGALSEYGLTQDLELWMYKQASAYFLFATSSFWILFDLTLNFLRDRPWDYKGKTSGWLDKLPYPIWYSGKIVALVLAGLSSWYYLKHV